jgi:hypothetical protein
MKNRFFVAISSFLLAIIVALPIKASSEEETDLTKMDFGRRKKTFSFDRGGFNFVYVDGAETENEENNKHMAICMNFVGSGDVMRTNYGGVLGTMVSVLPNSSKIALSIKQDEGVPRISWLVYYEGNVVAYLKARPFNFSSGEGMGDLGKGTVVLDGNHNDKSRAFQAFGSNPWAQCLDQIAENKWLGGTTFAHRENPGVLGVEAASKFGYKARGKFDVPINKGGILGYFAPDTKTVDVFSCTVSDWQKSRAE